MPSSVRAAALLRRAAVAVLLAALMVLLLAGWRLVRPHVVRAYDAVPVFRLHVVAHSDDPADQDMKLAVRDALLPVVHGLVDGADSAAVAYRRLLAASEELVHLARAVVREWGSDYPVTVVGEWDAAGDPVAVRVVIGAGRGRNWFCVLFPPLCFADGAGAAGTAPGAAPSAAGPQLARAAGLEPAEAAGFEAVGTSPPELTPADQDSSSAGGVRLAWRWLTRLPGLSGLFDRFGQVNEDHVHADLAHALPRDGHVGPTAE